MPRVLPTPLGPRCPGRRTQWGLCKCLSPDGGTDSVTQPPRQAFLPSLVKHGNDQPDPRQVAVEAGAAVSKAGWSFPLVPLLPHWLSRDPARAPAERPEQPLCHRSWGSSCQKTGPRLAGAQRVVPRSSPCPRRSLCVSGGWDRPAALTCRDGALTPPMHSLCPSGLKPAGSPWTSGAPGAWPVSLRHSPDHCPDTGRLPSPACCGQWALNHATIRHLLRARARAERGRAAESGLTPQAELGGECTPNPPLGSLKSQGLEFASENTPFRVLFGPQPMGGSRRAGYTALPPLLCL